MSEDLHRDWARPVMYRVTSSNLDTVKPGSVIVDDDNGDPVRMWHIWNPGTDSLDVGWSGRRVAALCRACFDLPTQLARPAGHDHPHGEGPEMEVPA